MAKPLEEKTLTTPVAANPTKILRQFWGALEAVDPDPWCWVSERLNTSVQLVSKPPPPPDLVAALRLLESDNQNKKIINQFIEKQLRIIKVTAENTGPKEIVRIFDEQIDAYIGQASIKHMLECIDIAGIRFLGAHAGLFSDLLPDSVYPHTPRCKQVCSFDQTRLALSVLDSNDSDFLERMRKLVSIVATTFPMPEGQRKAFTCRDTYLGCIFIDLHNQHWLNVLEDLVHETIHIDTWWRWYADPGLEIRCGNEKIQSPITGNWRPVATMLQAAIINSSIISLLQTIYNDFPLTDSSQKKYLVKRLEIIRWALPSLIASLQESNLPSNYKHALATIH